MVQMSETEFLKQSDQLWLVGVLRHPHSDAGLMSVDWSM